MSRRSDSDSSLGVEVGSFAVFVVAPAPVHGVVGDGGGEGLGVEVAVVVAGMDAVLCRRR